MKKKIWIGVIAVLGVFFLFAVGSTASLGSSDEKKVTEVQQEKELLVENDSEDIVGEDIRDTEERAEGTDKDENESIVEDELSAEMTEVEENEELSEESTENTDMTMGQKNALAKAQSYLSFSAFSHDGLIEQLKYEGFTDEEAMYGVDNCGADWSEQALEKAKDYLSFSAFSHDGLVEQLKYEGFTDEEAIYGADNCGADWNEQAAKKAEDYLSFSAFSRDELISQLKYEKFTDEQAQYGVTAAGY